MTRTCTCISIQFGVPWEGPGYEAIAVVAQRFSPGIGGAWV